MAALRPKLERRLIAARDPINPIEVFETRRFLLMQRFSNLSHATGAWRRRALAVYGCLNYLQETLEDDGECFDELTDLNLLTVAICVEAVAMWHGLDGEDDGEDDIAERTNRAQQCLRRCFPIMRQADSYSAYNRPEITEDVVAPLGQWFGVREEEYHVEA